MSYRGTQKSKVQPYRKKSSRGFTRTNFSTQIDNRAYAEPFTRKQLLGLKRDMAKVWGKDNVELHRVKGGTAIYLRKDD